MASSTDFRNALFAIDSMMVGLSPTLPRAIQLANRFTRRTYPGQTPDTTQKAAHQEKLFDLFFDQLSRHVGNNENFPFARYDLSVRIQLFRFLDSEHHDISWQEQLLLATNDVHTVRAALCFPGNLNLYNADPAKPTGLAGGALEFASWSYGTIAPQYLNATMRFNAVIDITNPT